MAEISPAEKAAIAEVLAPVFSNRRGKVFSLPENHEELEDGCSCDIVLRAPDGEQANFEHTRTKGNVELERIRPLHGGRVHDLLEGYLKDAGITGVIIVLGMDPPPAHPQEQERVAWWVGRMIAEKVRRGKLTYFNFDVVEDWEGGLRLVSKYLNKLIIAEGTTDAPAGIIRSDSRMGHLVDSVGDFREALEKKVNRYGKSASGKILVVDFDAFPLDKIDLPEVREIASRVSHAFDEVWAVNFRHRKNSWRLWPPDVVEIPKERT